MSERSSRRPEGGSTRGPAADQAGPTLGPTPGPAAPALGEARRRVAAALHAAGPDATLSALVEALGGHPNTTRAHLEGLVADGLASVRSLPGAGRGRPAQGWTLTAAGRHALTAPDADPRLELVGVLAAGLDTDPDAGGRAVELGRAWGARRRAERSVPAALDLLTELGFDPEPDGDAIRLRRCPFLGAARENPRVVCGVHEGFVQGALDDGDVRLDAFAEPGACLVRVTQP